MRITRVLKTTCLTPAQSRQSQKRYRGCPLHRRLLCSPLTADPIKHIVVWLLLHPGPDDTARSYLTCRRARLCNKLLYTARYDATSPCKAIHLFSLRTALLSCWTYRLGGIWARSSSNMSKRQGPLTRALLGVFRISGFPPSLRISEREIPPFPRDLANI